MVKYIISKPYYKSTGKWIYKYPIYGIFGVFVVRKKLVNGISPRRRCTRTGLMYLLTWLA